MNPTEPALLPEAALADAPIAAHLSAWPVSPAVGNSEALFRQLVHTHQKRLYRFVVKHIGWGSDAEDLTQQAFVEAAAAYATFRGSSELSTWLYGIAMNLVRNYLSRSPHRRFQFVEEEALDGSAAPGPDPARQMALSQTMVALQTALDALPPEMRDVLLLVALDELSYEDAAVMLSIPVGTVRSRVSRARATLRRRMDDAGHPSSLDLAD